MSALRAFLCWAPGRGETRETAVEYRESLLTPEIVAELHVRRFHDTDPLAEDDSVTVHVAEERDGVFGPAVAWHVVAVVEMRLRVRLA